MAKKLPDGFVERPTVKDRSLGAASMLRETATNGAAVLIKEGSAPGLASYLKGFGLSLHRTRKDAPTGMVYAWCVKNGDKK